MANEIGKTTTNIPQEVLNQSGTVTTDTKKKKNDEIGKDDFLTLLVTQLKHQDPLNPSDPEQFAVNLAQFSQLEQLVSINQKLDNEGSGGSTFGSLASYLGHEVVFSEGGVNISGADKGAVQVDLPLDAAILELEVLDSAGNVKGRVQMNGVSAGKHTISLEEADVAPGEYTVKAKAVSASGNAFDPDVHAVGVVTGFVPGPEPKLIVGNREVTPSDILEVRLPAAV